MGNVPTKEAAPNQPGKARAKPGPSPAKTRLTKKPSQSTAGSSSVSAAGPSSSSAINSAINGSSARISASFPGAVSVGGGGVDGTTTSTNTTTAPASTTASATTTTTANTVSAELGTSKETSKEMSSTTLPTITVASSDSSSSAFDTDDSKHSSRTAKSKEKSKEKSKSKDKSKGKPKGKAKAKTNPSGGLALDETVDGGYLHDHNVYNGPKDYDHAIVYQLVVERKLAPFFKGLEDIDPSWTDRQLLAAVRGLPIPAAEVVAPPTETLVTKEVSKEVPVSNLETCAAKENTPELSPELSVESPLLQEAFVTAASPPASSIASDTESTMTAEFPMVQASFSGSPSSHFMSTSLPIESTLSHSSLNGSLNPLSHNTDSNTDSHSTGSLYGHSATGSHRTISSNSDDDSLTSTVSTAATSAEDDDLLRHVLSLKAQTGHIEDTAAATNTNTNTSNQVSPLSRSRSKTTSQVSTAHAGPNTNANMKPIEVLLYREALECPICFLYHPKYINYTRCCSQPICTECFVEIKRPDPHRPHHDEDSADANGSNSNAEDSSSDLLVSEPACCPYCQAPDFGVIYIPPPFKSGLCSTGDSSSNSRLLRQSKAFFSGKKSSNNGLPGSLNSHSNPADLRTIVINASKAPENITSTVPDPSESIRRRGSMPPTAPEVITTDQIRPDWVLKLTSARHHLAKRSAAASALHATAFVSSPPSPSSSSMMSDSPDNASLASSNKSSKSFKNRLRGLSLGSLGGGSSSNDNNHNGSNMTAATARALYRELALESFLMSRDRHGEQSGSSGRRYSSVNLGGTAKTSRQIAKEVEEMMMMEAIRLSLYDQPNGEAEAVAVATSSRAKPVGQAQAQAQSRGKNQNGQSQPQSRGSNAKAPPIHA